MINVQEVARMAEWFRAKGMADTEILDGMIYIFTVVGLPTDDAPSRTGKSD